MALQQDERALLQLVCERGQGYADIAELLGIGEVEVRAKARRALTKLADADPDEVVGLTDYLLGQADPIGRADVVRYLQQDEQGRELAGTLAAKILMIAPEAELPTIPEPRGQRRRAAAPSPREEAARPVSREASAAAPSAAARRTPEQTRLIAGLAAGGIILLFVILAIAGVFSGSDDGADAAAVAESQRDVTSVALDPVDGSGVAGVANFALANTTLFVDLQVEGLDPDPGRGQAYLLWLMVTGDAGFPLPTPLVPNANGNFQDRIPIAAELLGVATAAQTVRVSRTSTQSLGEAVTLAAEEGSPVLAFDGKNLAAGEIPVADVAAGAETGAGDGGTGGSEAESGSSDGG